ncbi:thioesterase family protein [Sphingomonadaceae bacterium jetA1]|jgi:acyl-CoA thioester hydrolase|uniref:acyl-CoA thioesterase n=1 Tax=Facivitalis istanbulensis TaxID=3075838 RepID=UPI00347D6A2E
MTYSPNPDDFPLRATDKIRYADTDRQGHVNNAIFATLLETGRVELLYDPAWPLADAGSAFVIARLALDFRSEIVWPGEVVIGTRIAALGRSSIRLEQAIFQNGACAATAETVIVLMDETTRKSRPLPAAARERLTALFPEAGDV